MWSKVSCIRKQHDGRARPRTSDPWNPETGALSYDKLDKRSVSQSPRKLFALPEKSFVKRTSAYFGKTIFQRTSFKNTENKTIATWNVWPSKIQSILIRPKCRRTFFRAGQVLALHRLKSARKWLSYTIPPLAPANWGNTIFKGTNDWHLKTPPKITVDSEMIAILFMLYCKDVNILCGLLKVNGEGTNGN